jgi:hypothetical protein
MAALERERIRQDAQSSRLRYETTTLSFEDALDFYTKRGQTAERRSATSMREVSDLEQLRAKLSTDGFFRAIGQIGPMAQRISSGAMSQKDQNDFIIELKKLQLASTKALSQTDDAALARWTTAGTAVAGPGADRATTGAEIYKVALPELLNNGQYNPSLVGTVKALSAYAVPAEMADDWARVQAMAQDRTDQINDINSYASQIPDNISTVGPEAQAAAVSTFFKNVDPNQLNQFAQKLGSLPNPALLDQAILDKKTEAKVAKRVVDEYLQMDPFSLADKFAGGAAKAKDNERLRILSSEKFQKWAASNGLRVGSVRPATSEADKNLPGYIASTNSVYVAGAEDDRALGIATKQATMKPSQMLIPRRGLETRKYVEATVGGTAQPGLTGFTKVAFDDKAQKAVFIRADGSAVAEDGGSYDTELAAKLTSQPLAGEQLQKVNDDMAKTLTTTGGGQKIRGVETALMWSDPPDAIMAVETPEGKRVIIRKQDEKTINVLSGGKERKDGVVRSLLAKARERIARPGEAKLRAADEAAMSEVDKAREAELESKRQAEQAAKPDRMQPAAAKAAVETAVAEQPTEIKTPEGTQTFGDVSGSLGAARARQLIQRVQENPDLAMAPGVSDLLDKKISFVDRLEKVNPALYQQEITKLGDEANRILQQRTTGQVLSPGTEMPAEAKAKGRAAYLASQPEVKVTPTSTTGREVREASGVNMTGGNAPQMSGVATGTPASAPAVPVETDDKKRSTAALAFRRKQQFEREAKAMGADMMPNRLPSDQRAGTTEADRKL